MIYIFFSSLLHHNHYKHHHPLRNIFLPTPYSITIPPQLRSGGGWNHLMPELTPEPDSTYGENQKKILRKNKKTCET
jgi:hypothetical protein